MRFDIMTLFPEMVMNGLETSIIGRAVKNKILEIEPGISGTTHLTSTAVWMIIRMAAAQGC